MKNHSFKGFFVLFFLILTTSLTVFSQNVGINTTGTAPSSNAILDLNTGNNYNLGLIIPHVELGASLNTFSPPIANPFTIHDTGMMVYNMGGTQPTGYYCWNGVTWMLVSGNPAWNISGNAGTTPGTNFAGTSDAKDFVVKTNGLERMRFMSSGRAGIGTSTPQSGVDVNGSMSIGAYAGVNAAPANGVIISGNVGIATNSPLQALEVGGTTNTIRDDGLKSAGTYNIANGSAPLTSYMMFANTNGDLNAMAAGAAGSSMIWTATGPSWGNPTTSATAWQILGNSNIVDGTNFIGTTNNVPINFQINGNKAGRVDATNLNTFLGYQSGNATTAATTGNYNSAFGNAALFTNTSGVDNTAIGASALNLNSTSSNNTAVGYGALRANTGTGNTGIGYAPMMNGTTGTYNFAAGYLPMGSGVNTGSYNTAIGYEAMYKNTSGSYNSAIGYLPMGNGVTTGTGNIGIGYEPLYNATSGSYNSAIGYLPMGNGATTGTGNVGIGYEPLYNATSGGYNFAGGYFAMGNGATTGFYNTGIGYEALYSNTSGYYNIGIGYSALLNNTTGYSNVGVGYAALEFGSGNGYNNAIGYEAGYDNTGGYYNNAIGYYAGAINGGYYYNNYMGYYAGYDNAGGYYNNAMGMYSQEYSSGYYNNSMGYYALYGDYYGIQSGAGNNAFGLEAMYANYTGGYNNAFGGYAMFGNYSGYYNNAIGYGAMYGSPGSSTGYYNNAMGYYALDGITSGQYNNALGYEAMYDNNTGSYNVGLGYEALYNNTTGSNNTAVGYNAGVSTGALTNATAIGNGASATASNMMVLGNNAVTATEFSGALMPYYSAAYNAGAVGQILTSQGAGVSPKWTTISVPVTGANNGLTINSGVVQLGGPLIQNTTVTASASNYNMNHDLGTGSVAGTGQFNVTNGGSSNTYLTVQNSGTPGNPGQVGIGTSSPNPSAVLDINSASSGVLFPRLTSAQIAAIATPSNGLVLYNSTTNCLELFAGTWVNIVCGCVGPNAPTPITGTASICSGGSATYTCDTATLSGQVSTIWSVVPATATVTLSSVTSANITFPATVGTYTIYATPVNGTGCHGTPATYVVTVGNTVPATPGAITGPTPICVNSVGNVYSIAAVFGASSYTWTVPGSIGTITAGQGTTSMTMTAAAAPASGNISVTANNACGSSAAQTYSVWVGPPAAATTPVGPTSPNVSTVQTYTCAVVNGATGYTWTSTNPAVATITTQTANSCTVTFTALAGTTSICVTPTNACGSGTQACLSVTSSACGANLNPTVNLATMFSITYQAGYEFTQVNTATVCQVNYEYPGTIGTTGFIKFYNSVGVLLNSTAITTTSTTWTNVILGTPITLTAGNTYIIVYDMNNANYGADFATTANVTNNGNITYITGIYDNVGCCAYPTETWAGYWGAIEMMY